MINIGQYKESVEAFSRMDLKSSWVSFSKKQIMIELVAHDICLPQIKKKPYKIIRLMQRIFQFFFGGSNHLTTSQNLNRFMQEIKQILPDDEDKENSISLAERTSNYILTKLRRAAPDHQSDSLGKAGLQHLQENGGFFPGDMGLRSQ